MVKKQMNAMKRKPQPRVITLLTLFYFSSEFCSHITNQLDLKDENQNKNQHTFFIGYSYNLLLDSFK